MDARRNLAYGIVLTPPVPAASGTSVGLAVGNGTRFPPNIDGAYNAVVWPANAIPLPENAEIIRVTSRTGDTLSPIIRQQEGTNARAIGVGDQVMLGATDKVFDDLEALIAAAQAAAEAYSDAALAVEVARAEAAEALLASSSALTAEISRATTAEGLLAPKASPALTGTPTAPTATALDASTKIATTAYADAAVGVEASARASAVTSEASTRSAADALLAPLASPALTGSPTAPTATTADNTTKLATTAFVQTASGLLIPKSLVTTKGDLIVATASATLARLAVGADGLALVADSAQTNGVKYAAPTPAAHAASHASAGTDAVTLAESQVTNLTTDLAAKAPLASPALTGTPTAPTASALDASTKLATTAYADAAVAVENSRATTAEALLAPKASPALTGSPTAPTQAQGDKSTKIATTAYADAVGAGDMVMLPPRAYGMLAFICHPDLWTSSFAYTAGNLHLFRIDVPVDNTFSNFLFWQTIAGTGVTNAFCGLLDSTGARIAISTDQTTGWNTGTGVVKTVPFITPAAVTGGPTVYIYAAWLSVGGTTPSLAYHATNWTGVNFGVALGSGARTLFKAGQTTIPTSNTLSGFTANDHIFIGGLS